MFEQPTATLNLAHRGIQSRHLTLEPSLDSLELPGIIAAVHYDVIHAAAAVGSRKYLAIPVFIPKAGHELLAQPLLKAALENIFPLSHAVGSQNLRDLPGADSGCALRV